MTRLIIYEKKMKKIIIITILTYLFNTSISIATDFGSKWGVVIDVTPISITTNYSEPDRRLVCKKSRNYNSSNFADVAVGGLIGSVIGNKISDVHGAGTIGALFGSMIALDNPKRQVSETCYEKTIYLQRKITKFSHYDVKVRTKRKTINIQSSTPYNVHDVIFLTN